MIIDIHAHVNRENNVYKDSELLEDMEKNNIDLRVVSTMEGSSIKEANTYISNLVKKNSNKLIGCAVINPKLDSAIDDINHAISLGNIQMIEFNSFEHGYYPDNCENLEKVLEIIEENNIIVKTFTGIGARSMPHQWEVMAKKFPKVKFIFLHMGCFDYGYNCIDIAKRNDNIYVETSNQYEMQILKKAFNNLDASKIIFGSSFPDRFTKCSIDIFDMFKLEKEELNSIYSDNAKRLLNI